MPRMYRRGSKNIRPQIKAGSYYRPAKRQSALAGLIQKIQRLPGRFKAFVGAVALVLALTITAICLFSGNNGSTATNNGKNPNLPKPTPTSTDPTVTLPPRIAALAEPIVTPEAVSVRDISFGSINIKSKDKLINEPGIYKNEVLYSAGSGSLENKDDTLKRLYIYNVETGEEVKIADSKLAGAGFYETQINTDWLVWLETDHYDKNHIYVMSRETGEKTKIRDCKNGKPKLRLAGDTLIWMEVVDKNTDQLMMFDLKSHEDLPLFKFTDVVTYGVSAPGIYAEPINGGTEPVITAGISASPAAAPTPTPTPTSTPTATTSAGGTPQASASAGPEWENTSRYNTTIVWADTDKSQTPEQKQTDGERSTIYWLRLGEDAIMDDSGTLKTSQFNPGTYVHDPLYNGKYFVWIDSNYAPKTKLYISEPNGTPKVIDTGITTYSLGDGIVVYSKSQQVWIYVIATGEYCRLTNSSEIGILPASNGRTVVWFDKTGGGVDDKLRYKVLTDSDIMPGDN